jgi:hypothetical protein
MKDGSEGFDISIDMDLLDFLLAISLLSRIPVDNKIKRNNLWTHLIVLSVVMFELCDSDNDGCMNPL